MIFLTVYVFAKSKELCKTSSVHGGMASHQVVNSALNADLTTINGTDFLVSLIDITVVYM